MKSIMGDKKNIVGEKLTTINRGGVVVSPNIVTTRVMVDQWGNEIDPRTKQIIKKAGQN